MYKLNFKKVKEPEIKLPACLGSQKKELQKNIYFCFIEYTKVFVSITTNCGIFLKRWEHQTTLPVSWETCMKVKKEQLKLDMEQWTGSELGKEYVKPVCLTSMQNTSCGMLGWMNHKLNQDCREKYQQLQMYRWCHSNGRKWRGTKEPLDEGEREWKSWLKTQHSKN